MTPQIASIATAPQKRSGAKSPFRSEHAFGVLDDKQIGSLRHIGNLARQLTNDWSGMMGPAHMKEDFGAYRYQLAYMSYALALAHFNRLPAAPGLFKNTFMRLVEKMLLPEVWWYWKETSQGGSPMVPDLPMREGWADPIIKENIMYSAYLQSMALMYNVLFDDDRFARPGALTLKYLPTFWNNGVPFEFEYDQNSVNERIYWNMVESGYLGVACEANCVFQICNQPAIIGFRMHDHLNGGSIAEEVTEGYIKAWNEFGGMLDERGHYQTLVVTHRNEVIPGLDTWSDAWLGTLMNSWNPEFVKAQYTRQRDRWVVRDNHGLMQVRPVEDMQYPEGLLPTSMCDLGWTATWASEVGDVETLEGLLAYADTYLSPQYSNGGYYYPRNDETYDEEGRMVGCHPSQSNALFPYARLNVKDGLHNLYTHLWGKEHFAEPALSEVDFSIDIYRAVWDDEHDRLLFDAALSEAHKGRTGGVLISRILYRGDWILSRDGEKIAWGDSSGLSGKTESSVHQKGADLYVEITHLKPAAYAITCSGKNATHH